ncbi:MAG: MATE family efflux transporter [Lachnospiraceae bacterium]|nr:MATE family efflux transporter [Lachnospiraceae bacterium]
MNKKSMDLTKGTIWKQLLLFALPLLGASLIQQLYNTVDLLFVGNFVGKEASASIGSSSIIITCLVGFFTGMSVGTSVAVAKAVGAKDKKKLFDHIHTAIAFSFVGGLVLTVLGYIGAPYFLRWVGVPEEIMPMSLTYMRVYFFGTISIVTYNLGSGIIRAMGDSKSPMVIQLAGGIVNVIMNTIFIVVLKAGVAGAAYATIFSQTSAALMTLYYLVKKNETAKLHFRKLRIRAESMKEILKVGVPSGLQSIVISFSNIIIQSRINSFGVDAMAAFSAYFKVELLIYLPILAFGQAMTTFAGQNMGANNPVRVHKGTKNCIIMGIIYAVVSAAILLVLGDIVFGIFNHDPAVISYGRQLIRISFPFYWVYVILEVLSATLRGTGKAVAPMVITVCNICILRTIVLFVIMMFFNDIRGVAMTYPISWSTTSICMYIYYRKYSYRLES